MNQHISRQSLRDTVQQFGFPIERFLPGRGPARALRIVGLIDLVLGIALAGFALATGRATGWVIAAACLAVSGIIVIVMSKRFNSGGVLVCPRGLVFAKSGQIDTCAWEQIRAIRETSDHGVEGNRVVVERRDGAPSSISAADVGSISRFTEVLKKETDRRKIAWASE